MSTNLFSWQLFALASAFFAALTAILAKIGVTGIDSNIATWVRTVVILILTSIVLFFSGRWNELQDISQKNLIFLCLSGLATGLSWLCYFKALQLGPASKVVPVDKLSVVIVIILSALILKESLTWKVSLGGLMIAVGAILLTL